MCCWNFIMANDRDFYVDFDDADEQQRAPLSPLMLDSVEYKVGADVNSRGFNLTPVSYNDIVQAQPTTDTTKQKHIRAAPSKSRTNLWIVCC